MPPQIVSSIDRFPSLPAQAITTSRSSSATIFATGEILTRPAAITRAAFEAAYADDTDRLLEALLTEVRPGDVVLIMSNGGFDNLHQRLLDAL